MPISASVRSYGARTGTVVAAALTVTGLTLAGASSAFAAPGDSGDISVQSVDSPRGQQHDATNAKLCKFKLVAANFGELPTILWAITSQPPAIGNTLGGNLPLSQGKANSAEYRLPDGTYQLTWTAPGSASKAKTFEVDCSHEARKQGNPGSKADGSSWSGNQKGEGSSWSGSDGKRPSGAVAAGGGGVPTMESVSSESGSDTAMTTALVTGAAGLAGLIFVRRAARRRSSGAA